MFALAHEILAEDGLDFDLLQPLITETASKVAHINPIMAQTGAAKRNDQETMAKHLRLIEDQEDLAELYRLISASIARLEQKSDD